VSSPTHFGDYAILGEIARGGQGVVYRARHPSGKVVALKVLLEPDASTLKRFGQEARVLAKLGHPNLLRVYEHGSSEGAPFLAVELIEGQDLYVLLKENGLPRPEWVATVLVKVALALEYCHQRGVIHRDLKPANVLVERATQRPVLVDFGLVKRDPNQMHLTSIDDASVLSLSGTIKGTPEYMSPEQVNPSEYGDVGATTDVYGLGAVLYHLLTGAPPFTGRAAVVVMRKVTRKAPKSPRELNPSIPAPLADLCLRCLAKSQADRPQTALAFAEALARAAGLPAPVAPTPPASGELLLSGDLTLEQTAVALPGRLPAVGDRFAGYEIVSSVARGASGAVFVARRSDGERCALKVLLAGLSDDNRRQRFEREAEVGRDLAHPGVVAIQGAGVEGGMAYLVMEYLDGSKPIDAFARSAQLSTRSRLELVLQLVEAVEAAHKVDLIHRDLKPENVLVTPKGEVKVVDFGLAKHLDKERMTMSGAMYGTVRYMAPEQVMGRSAEADARTDVYAVGVILYELLSGDRPFDGGNALEIMAGILSDDPADPCRDLPDAPEGLRDVVLKAMAREADARYSNASALGRDLVALITESPHSVSALDERLARQRVRIVGLGLVALVLVALVVALGLSWARGVDPEVVRQRASRISEDAWSLCGESESLLAEADRVSALRERLDGLRDADADASLTQARVRVRALEGLLALARGDDGLARIALGELGGRGVCADALAGAVAGVTTDGDPQQAVKLLSAAIARGIRRPELRAWRAAARVRAGLASRADATEVVEDLGVVERALGSLTPLGRTRRARAQLVLGEADAASAEIKGIDAPLGLRWSVALSRAEHAIHERPEQALEWLASLPPQDPRDPKQWTLGRTARVLLTRRAHADPRTEEEIAVVLVYCRLVRLLLQGDPLGGKLASAISDICTGFDARGVTAIGITLSAVLAELCPSSVKIQREVAFQLSRVRSRLSKQKLVPALRRLIVIGEDSDARVEHQLLLAKTLAFFVVESPVPDRLEAESKELSTLIGELQTTFRGPHAESTLLGLRSCSKRAAGDLEGALADLNRALAKSDAPGLHYWRMKTLLQLGRGDDAFQDAASFVLAVQEPSVHLKTAARLVWGRRALDPALARQVAAKQLALSPDERLPWVREAWFLASEDPGAGVRALEQAAERFLSSGRAELRAFSSRSLTLSRELLELGEQAAQKKIESLAAEAAEAH
jgi:serine/threonine protein kinase